jgi:hypothetical protein
MSAYKVGSLISDSKATLGEGSGEGFQGSKVLSFYGSAAHGSAATEPWNP